MKIAILCLKSVIIHHFYLGIIKKHFQTGNAKLAHQNIFIYVLTTGDISRLKALHQTMNVFII